MALKEDDTTKDELDRDPVYYYSREHRLNKASQTVRALNEGGDVRPSLAKTLFGTRGNLFVLASISIICLMFVVTSRFSAGERKTKLGGNTLAITITREEGVFFLDIVKDAPKRREVYTGDVWFAISPVLPKSQEGGQPDEIMEMPKVFTEYITFSPVGHEVFNFLLPFAGSIGSRAGSDAFYIVLSAGDKQKALKINAVQK